MDETTVVEAPSASTVPEIPASGSPEYATWRATGELPEKVQPKAESAPAPTETRGAEPQQQQEKRRKPDAEARIRQLTEDLKRVRSELDEVRRPKPTQAAPSPARQEQQGPRPKPAVDAIENGKPKYNTYEDYVEDLADWKAEQRLAQAERQQQARQQQSQLQSKVDDARTRYGDQFDQVLSPTVSRIMAEPSVSPTVKAMLNDSDVLPDLIYTLGSSSQDFQSFLRMPPGKQLRYIAALETGIQEELTKPRNNGQQAEAPAKRGPESTPEPPLEVGQRGGGSMSESERALQAVLRGDGNAFRAFKQAEDRKALARRRGA